MRISIEETAKLLAQNDNILILTHANPDGDTLGSGYGLCSALLNLGKKARVVCADEIPKKYSYFTDKIPMEEFNEDFIVSVDTATESLFGSLEEKYSGKINLCIDHHPTNTNYAENLLLIGEAASCAEIIYLVIRAIGAEVDELIANCLYTGITTDTGCFRYAGVSASTYKIAGELVECGANNGFINRMMFENKTKTYIKLEKLALDSMMFFYDERVAVITVTQEMYEKTGSNEMETEAIAPITRQIEGVLVGLTIREKPDKTCKVSIRTFEEVSASEIAKAFGGGGHSQAAACRFDCDVDTARKLIVEKCGEFLK